MTTPSTITTTRPAIITICGSTRFATEIAKARAEFTLAGFIVLGPEVLVRSDPAYSDLHDSSAKVDLDELHMRKIDLSDTIYVVNPGGYIGESTAREIQYAWDHRKPVGYLTSPIKGPAPSTGLADIVRDLEAATDLAAHLTDRAAHYDERDDSLVHFARDISYKGNCGAMINSTLGRRNASSDMHAVTCPRCVSIDIANKPPLER